MEGLERLQSVHVTLRLMREHSLCVTGRGLLEPADRFMAEFLLFLSQTRADAEELKEKCDTLMKRLPEVSITFLQALVAEKCTLEVPRICGDAVNVQTTGCDALLVKNTTVTLPIGTNTFSLNNGKDSNMIFKAEDLHGSKSQTHNTPPHDVQEESQLATPLLPLMGLKAMERANTTLEDFCRSYFMFHAMDVHNPQHLFKHLPILSFVEAFIYQLDEENEEQLKWQNRGMSCNGEQSGIRRPSCAKALGMEPFRELQRTLAVRGLLTDRIESELRDGAKYWRLEQALCESMVHGSEISAEDVLRAIKLKSFDYRVLNLLLYSLTGREVNEAHFKFLAVSELLVEISDDLFDYEDDILKNSFNILRMFLKVYGPVKAPEMLAKLISEEEMKYQHLLEGLEPILARCYQERCKEATTEGGGGSKHQFGSWTIPPLIVNEVEFRTQLSHQPNEY